MENVDIMIIGQLSLDINTDFDGRVEHSLGGAARYSGFAADASGAKTAVLVIRPDLFLALTVPVVLSTEA